MLLSRAITIIESTRQQDREIAKAILNGCLPHAGNSIRLGITGVPGVGKSTFIEAFGSYLTETHHKIAVLAIDPSSERSGGSILGDKTRMESLASNPNAFIRPSPSSGSLGGVARNTRETMLLCEAAGFDTIVVETVGVGQSETAVHSMVDFFLLLMLAGAGDELQGIKRGIMEMADALVINKADGDNVKNAKRARAEYQAALHLFPPSELGWTPRVATCSALEKTGIDDLWEIVEEYHRLAKGKNYFSQKRQTQARYWLHQTVTEKLHQSFFERKDVQENLTRMEQEVLAGTRSPFEAAEELLKNFG